MFVDYVQIPNILSADICNELVEYAKNNISQTSKVYNTKTRENIIKEDLRKSKKVILENSSKYYDIIQKKLDNIYVNDNIFEILRDEAEIIIYEEGEYFKKHHDYEVYESNYLKPYSLLIYLNDDYVGGETILHQNEKEIKIKYETGKGLLFKNMLEHESIAIKKSAKYVLKIDVVGRVNVTDKYFIIKFINEPRFYVVNAKKISKNSLIHTNYEFNLKANANNPEIITFEELSYDDFVPFYEFIETGNVSPNDDMTTEKFKTTYDYLQLDDDIKINVSTENSKYSFFREINLFNDFLNNKTQVYNTNAQMFDTLLKYFTDNKNNYNIHPYYYFKFDIENGYHSETKHCSYITNNFLPVHDAKEILEKVETMEYSGDIINKYAYVLLHVFDTVVERRAKEAIKCILNPTINSTIKLLELMTLSVYVDSISSDSCGVTIKNIEKYLSMDSYKLDNNGCSEIFSDTTTKHICDYANGTNPNIKDTRDLALTLSETSIIENAKYYQDLIVNNNKNVDDDDSIHSYKRDGEYHCNDSNETYCKVVSHLCCGFIRLL